MRKELRSDKFKNLGSDYWYRKAQREREFSKEPRGRSLTAEELKTILDPLVTEEIDASILESLREEQARQTQEERCAECSLHEGCWIREACDRDGGTCSPKEGICTPHLPKFLREEK